MIRAVLLLLAGISAMPAMVAAQETRAGTIADEQAEKATHLAPYQPHWAEGLLLRVREGMVEQPYGFYPFFDSVYSGGGFTLGAGYRRFTGDNTQWSLSGLYSAKGYNLLQAEVASPAHFSGLLDLRANVVWRDATRVRYYGLGIDSLPEDDTAFRMQQVLASGDVIAHPRRWLQLTAAVSYEDYTIKDPTGDYNSVEDMFDPSQAPGVGVNPAYLHTTGSVAFDSRPAADYARRGGLYRVARHHYADRDHTYSFDRLDAEAVQHLPILRENWVVSLRGRLESTLGDDDQVPYFLLPSLGSGGTLRGYNAWRFRDRHAMLVSGEWRWIPSRLALDMALFYDAGMVAPALDAIVLRSFASDFGVGRFHAPAKTVLRVEVAKGSEGVQLVFSSGAAF